MPTSILILGGGFAGCQAALTLARAKLPDTTIRLMDPKTYFEYHAALYRFVTGTSPMETCIPYRDIFDRYPVDVVRDTAVNIDATQQTVRGASGSHYHYDHLLLALGSETCTFGIEGIRAHSFGMKSAEEALRLKNHIERIFLQAKEASTGDRDSSLRFVVVGGGASGIELAGELASYTRQLAKMHELDERLVNIDLVEAADRLLPDFPEAISRTIEHRLASLGVTVRLKQSLLKEEADNVTLSGEDLRTKTVVWTAGMRGNVLAESTQGFTLDRKKRVTVAKGLCADGTTGRVYVLGDLAATKHSGMAQTALYDGNFVAQSIIAGVSGKSAPVYNPPVPVTAIPVGPRWALVVQGTSVVTGYRGWILRRVADFRVFWKLLPLRKAIRAFRCIARERNATV